MTLPKKYWGYVFISFAVKLLIDLPLMLLGYILVPFALLQEKNNHLPIWAEWCWGNKDHGNDGETFWAKRTIGWSRFRRCYWWLAVRNPTFNWSKYILGFKSTGESKVVWGDTHPIGDTKAAGQYFAFDGWAWEYYIVIPYTIFGFKRCFRFRAGWKILGKDSGEITQFVFAPSPIHSYSGK